MVKSLKSILLLLLGLTLFGNFADAGGTNFSWDLLMHLRNSCLALRDTFGISLDSLNFDPDSLIIDNPSFLQDPGVVSGNVLLTGFMVPWKGRVISHFGARHGRMHTGTDVKLNLGDTVTAAYNGIVTKAKSYYGYGSLVVLQHGNNLETYYAHLSKILVKEGDIIRTGQPVGLGGRTGRATTEHLHFEIRENKKPYNAEWVFNFDTGKLRPEALATNSIAGLLKVFNKKVESTVIKTLNNQVDYVIKAGDNLWEIARKFSTSIQSLCEINDLQTTTVLQVGSKIKLK
jgi:murein DD-endopeptidase MepM/ murein hydrolase activator NlpD